MGNQNIQPASTPDDAARLQALVGGNSTAQTQPVAQGQPTQNNDAARLQKLMQSDDTTAPAQPKSSESGFMHSLKQAFFLEPSYSSPYVKNPTESDVTGANLQAAQENQPAISTGAQKGLVTTLSGTSQLLGKAADKAGLRNKTNQQRGIFGEAPATAAETNPEGAGETAGYIGENLVEFAVGDEALKGLSLAERLGLATRLAKLAESHPAIAKIIGLGLRASRTGTVSGAQAAAHGGDASDVVDAAETGFGSSVLSEGLGALGKLAKPGTKQIAGETLQTAPKWKSAATLAKLVEANQEPAQRVIGNVARDSADAVMQKLGKAAPATISSFQDAAEAVEGAAKPVFRTLDKLSDGEYQVARNQMQKALKVMRNPGSMEALDGAEQAYQEASGKIDKIFDAAKNQVSPEDLKSAKSAWKSMKTLEELHTKIDAAYDMPQSAAELADSKRTLQLGELKGKLNAAFKNIEKADLESVLGKVGTKNLYDLAALGADPMKSKSFMDVAKEIGNHISAGTFGAGAGALLGHMVPGGAVGVGIRFLYTHPQAGAIVVKGLSAGSSPKVVVPAILQLLQSERQAQSQ